MRQRTMRLATFAILAFLMIVPMGSTNAATLYYGSSNGDVWDLQFRLNTAGYFSEKLDGHYGHITADAVRRFQKDYGIPADGIAGDRTWKALKKVSVNRQELDMLAKLIYGEARGESYVGQVAVGAVVMNRIQSPDFPHTVAEVIFEPRAFTAIDDGQYWMTPDATAYKAALDAVRGWDPSHGSLFYFNPDTATSAWIWSRPQKVTIGAHIFCL